MVGSLEVLEVKYRYGQGYGSVIHYKTGPDPVSPKSFGTGSSGSELHKISNKKFQIL
jgi:hypothetical protein